MTIELSAENPEQGDGHDAEQAQPSMPKANSLQVSEEISAIFHVVERGGIHLRVAARIQQIVTSSNSEVKITRLDGSPHDSKTANGASCIEMLKLEAYKGVAITIDIKGIDAQEVLKKLEADEALSLHSIIDY